MLVCAIPTTLSPTPILSIISRAARSRIAILSGLYGTSSCVCSFCPFNVVIVTLVGSVLPSEPLLSLLVWLPHAVSERTISAINNIAVIFFIICYPLLFLFFCTMLRD